MIQKEQKSAFGRFFQSRLFFVVIFLALLFISLSFVRAYYEDYQVREKIRELEGQVRELEGKKIDSLQMLKYVKSDDFLEEKARTELNLKKPGEKVIFVDGIVSPTSTKSGAQPVDEKRLSNPMKWWYYFTHQSY